MRIGFAALALIFCTVFFATTALAQSNIDLPKSVQQGGLISGKVAAGFQVEVLGRTLRLAEDGSFVCGVGRDQTDPLVFTLTDGNGLRSTQSISVVTRQYKIERVNGLAQGTVTPNPTLEARIAREQAEVTQARKRDDARRDFRFGFTQPLQGRVSGVYGSQRILNGTPKSPHMGLDIAAPTGTAIKAPAAGLITFAKTDLYLTGGTLVIDHGHGISSSFLHMSRIDVTVGQRIDQGQIVGAVGATGRASGPHLHWGMNWFEQRLDPGLLIGF